ncbi:MAG: class I SAM-dependent methyltransferase [Bryobacteraceae bacterium]
MASPYDVFAWFYDRYWNERFHHAAFPVIERIFLSHLPRRAAVLDLCCGTGYLAGLIVPRGFRVTGIDGSREMIRCARRKVPEAQFRVADCRRFRSGDLFDGVVSTFDSLNHILTAAELEQVCMNVARATKKGGLFAFDILLEQAYRTKWADNFALVRDDHVLAITGDGFHESTGIAQCRITMFRHIKGKWQRSDVTVQERCYTTSEVTRALEGGGFSGVTIYDARDLGMQGELGEGRAFVTARRTV